MNVTSGYDADFNLTFVEDGSRDDFLRAASTRVRVRFFLMGIIIPLGLTFNTTAFIVLVTSRKLRKTASTHFLMALTFADSAYLFGELLYWMCTTDPYWGSIFGLTFVNSSQFWCRTTFFLRVCGQFWSSWLTVAIATERLTHIWFPLQAEKIFTNLKIDIIILCITVVSMALTTYPYWIYAVHYSEHGNFYYCVPYSQTLYHYWDLSIFRIGSLAIPGIIVFTCTFLIIMQLRQIRKAGLDVNNGKQGSRTQQERSKERQLSAMLLLVAIAFVILRLPYSVFSFVHVTQYGFRYSGNFAYNLALDITHCIAATNYAVNFFLYCLSGSMFRSHFRSCLRCNRAQKEADPTRTDAISMNMLL